MPPSKNRTVLEDTTTEASNGKDKHTTYGGATIGRGRRNGASHLVNGSSLKEVISSKDIANATNGTAGHTTQKGGAGSTGFITPELDRKFLQAYRSAHTLPTPSSFKNPTSHFILRNGIGKFSPTMAQSKVRSRVSKDQLALSIRKHFNASPVSETEVIVDSLYKAKFQNKEFRMRFAPPRAPR